VQNRLADSNRLNPSIGQHWTIALLDVTVALLRPVVQVLAVTMQSLTTGDPPDSLPVCRMLVCGWAKWSPVCGLNQAPEKTACCVLIPLLAEHRVQEVAFTVDCPVEVTPAAVDPDIRLVQVPGTTGASAPSSPEPLAYQWGEAILPGPDCLVADLEASLEEQFGNIPEPQLVAKTPENCLEDNVRRELQIVERCPGPLIEPPLTVPAIVNPVAQGGPGFPAKRGLRLAARAGRGQLLSLFQRMLFCPCPGI
jgi:hypothetical protein